MHASRVVSQQASEIKMENIPYSFWLSQPSTLWPDDDVELCLFIYLFQLVCNVLELTSKHRSTGSNCYRSSVVEEAVLRSPGVDMAEVRRQSSPADQRPL